MNFVTNLRLPSFTAITSKNSISYFICNDPAFAPYLGRSWRVRDADGGFSKERGRTVGRSWAQISAHSAQSVKACRLFNAGRLKHFGLFLSAQHINTR